MKHFKQISTSVVAIIILLSLSTCNKQSISDTQQEVSFNIKNVTNIVKKGVGDNFYNLPACSDAIPAYVMVTLDEQEPMKLNILSGLNDGTETVVIKLDAPATHTIKSFMVYSANGDLIWAAPMEGSHYAELWSLSGLGKEFDVLPFKKSKIDIDVLCWEPYMYKDFGFTWFDFDMIKVKTLCFFGDICVDDYLTWHESPSPYFGQDYDGYDFPAIFKVEIKSENGDILNDENANSNLSWMGENSPLCIEYPDFVGQDDNYVFEIYLMKPDGTYDNDPYIVKNFKAEDNYLDISGDDGVFDFDYGICTTDDDHGTETCFAKFRKLYRHQNGRNCGHVFVGNSSKNPEDYPMLGISTRWGWAGNIKNDGEYICDIWAAAGQNDTRNGFMVGKLTITKNGNNVRFNYRMDSGFENSEIQLYCMDTPPTNTANGNYTYGNGALSGVFEDLTSDQKKNFSLSFDIDDSDGDGIWVIAHSEVNR